MTTNEKLALLRKRMREEEIDVYYVPTSDPHMSEYIAPCFQTRAWLTGFTGSAGAALVFADDARLWADGRYFIQAANQIKDSEFELMKMGTPGYPRLLQYLVAEVPEGGRVGVNGSLISEQEVQNIRTLLEEKNATLVTSVSLVEDIWEDIPSLPAAPVFLLAEKYSGRSTVAKLADLRSYLKERKVDAALFGRLDDIAWLYNVRGGDIESTPVALAYALVTIDTATLFIAESKVSDAVRSELASYGVEIRPYSEVGVALQEVAGYTLTLDKNYVNSAVYSEIPRSTVIRQAADWTSMQKALKNATEIENEHEAYRKDGVALARLLYWLKHLEDPTSVTELEVSDKLEEFHQEQSDYLEPSFTTIAAYGPNAAMMHYAPTAEACSTLAPSSFLLVDSGGQYLEGTTDTTRTIAMGPLSDEEIRDYTLTLKGHIALAKAVFMQGSTGYYLDALARQPLWKHHQDYKSGTGHGIGYLLSVHEGPQSISPRRNDTALEPGMIVSNEPGVYKEGKHGIRIENVYAVRESGVNDTDVFYEFECFTLVPLEREAIDVTLFTAEEVEWVNEFHARVAEKIAPSLGEDEAAWLREVCREL